MANMAKRVDVGDKGKYRKVDVDAIDEDLYRDDETDESGLEQLVTQRASEVRALLGKGGSVRDAVAKSLERPPFGSKNQAVKDKNLETVMAAVTAVKSTDIAGVVRSLDADSLDVLMKYLYAGMAAPEKYNAGSLLAWHEVVVESAGLASIVRVLTDRKTA